MPQNKYDFSNLDLPPVPGTAAPAATEAPKFDFSGLDLKDLTPPESSWTSVISKTLQNIPERAMRGINAIRQDLFFRNDENVLKYVAPATALLQSAQINPAVRDQVKAMGLTDKEIDAWQPSTADTEQYVMSMPVGRGMAPTDIAVRQFQPEVKLANKIRQERAGEDPEYQKLLKEAKSLSDELHANAPQTREWSPKDLVSSILGATVEMAPGVAVGVATRSPFLGLATMSGQAYGQYLAEGQDKGLSPEQNRQRAALLALAEGVSEKIPLGKIMNKTGKWGIDIAKAGFSEGIQESATQALQIGYDAGVLNENMTLGQALNDMAKAGVVGMGAGATMAGVARPFAREEAPAAAAPAEEAPAAAAPVEEAPAAVTPDLPPIAPAATTAEPAQPGEYLAEDVELADPLDRALGKEIGKDAVVAPVDNLDIIQGRNDALATEIEAAPAFTPIAPVEELPTPPAAEVAPELPPVPAAAEAPTPPVFDFSGIDLPPVPAAAAAPELPPVPAAGVAPELPPVPAAEEAPKPLSKREATQYVSDLGMANTLNEKLKTDVTKQIYTDVIGNNMTFPEAVKKAGVTPEIMDTLRTMPGHAKYVKEIEAEEAAKAAPADEIRFQGGSFKTPLALRRSPAYKAAIAAGDTVDIRQSPEGDGVYGKVIPKAATPEIQAARATVNTEPSDAQIAAGNYQKGHVKIQGLDISLENPKGSTRSGTDEEGKAWKTTMQNDYGYIKRTEGADGDQVDVYVGDKPDSERVFVVNQVNPKTGEFDEHKVMLGFDKAILARRAYMKHYQKGWKGFGDMTEMTVPEFKQWLKTGDQKTPLAPAPVEEAPAITETKPTETVPEPAITETKPAETVPEPAITETKPAETVPKPAETVPVREGKTRAQSMVMDEFGEPGETLTFSRSVGKAKADTRYEIRDVSRTGELTLRNVDTGEQVYIDRDQRRAAAGAFTKGKKLPPHPSGVSREDIPHRRAYDAYYNISHTPEERADQVQAAYVDHMQEVYDELHEKATTPDQRARAGELFNEYREGYIKRQLEVLAAKSRTASPMITGPARFPVERNRKAMDSEMKKAEAFAEWRNKTLKRMKAEFLPPEARPARAGTQGIVEQLEQRIASREKAQEQMKAANAIIRSGKNVAERLQSEAGLTEAQATEIMKPDHMGREGFQRFELSNNNAEIRRLKQRLEIEKKRLAVAEAGPTTAEFPNGGEVTFEESRIKIAFNGKPDAETIAALKAESFRWAPKQRVWWRQDTAMGRGALARAKSRLKAAEPAPVEEAPAPAPVEEAPAPAPVEDAPAPAPVEEPAAAPVTVEEVAEPATVEERLTPEAPRFTGYGGIIEQIDEAIATAKARPVTGTMDEAKATAARIMDEAKAERKAMRENKTLSDSQKALEYIRIDKAAAQRVRDELGNAYGYVTFRGDGKQSFKVLDVPEHLETFKKKLEAANKGKGPTTPPGPRTTLDNKISPRLNLSRTKADQVQEFIDDKEFDNAYYHAQNLGLDLIYGSTPRGDIIPQVPIKSFIAEGIEFAVVKVEKGDYASVNPDTGLRAGTPQSNVLKAQRATTDAFKNMTPENLARVKQKIQDAKDENAAEARRLQWLKQENIETDRTVLPQASRVDEEFEGLAHDVAEKTVSDFLKALPGTSPISYIVLPNQENTPLANVGKVKGLYIPEALQLVVFSDNFNSVEDLQKTLRHEVVVHYGLRALMPKTQYNEIMDSVLAAEGRDARISETFKDIREIYDGWIDTTHPDGQRMIAEEVVARLSRDEAKAPGLIKRIIEAIKKLAMKIKLLPAHATYQDVQDLIESNAAGLRSRTIRAKDVLRHTPPQGLQVAPTEGRTPLADLGDLKKTGAPQDVIDDIESVLYDEKPRSVWQKAQDTVKPFLDPSRWRQWVIDEFESVRQYEISQYGELQDADRSAYKMLAMSKNIASVIGVAMNKGHIQYKNGTVSFKDNTKGLLDIFRPLADLGKDNGGDYIKIWEYWAGAIRAKRLIKEGREKLYTQEQIDRILNYVNSDPKLKAAFNQAHKDWREFNKSTLDFAEAAGLINPDERAVWQNDDYVPFYRYLEEEEGDGVKGPFGKKGVAGQTSGIRRLKGGTGRMDIVENMIRNTSHLIEAGYKNIAMQRVVDMVDGIAVEKVPLGVAAVKLSNEQIRNALNEIGVATTTMTNDELNSYSTFFHRIAPTQPGVVSVMREGKREYYRVDDPLLYKSVTGVGADRLNAVINLMGLPKRWFTALTTSDPDFIVRNFVRDTASTWVQMTKEAQGDMGHVIKDTLLLRPLTQAIRGAVKSYQKDTDVWHMYAAGGMSGEYFGTTPKKLSDHVRSLRKEKGWLGTAKHAVEAYRKVVESSEMANRIAIYDRVIKNGGSVAEASYQSLDIMNFSRHGSSEVMRTLIAVVPFMNARVQGLERLYRGARENPAAFAMKGMILTALTMAQMGLNADREEYWALPEYDRDTNWHFWIGNEHFRMPKPFEVGAFFGTIPERLYEAATRDEKVFLNRMGHMVVDTFSMNPIPQFAMPIVEEIANKSFFTDKSIVSQALENVRPEQQYSPFTSKTMRAVANAMPDWMPDALRSPVRLEHVFRGYTSTVGGYVLSMTDAMVNTVTDAPVAPARRLSDMPVVSSFYRGTEGEDIRSTKYPDRFYKMTKEANQAYSSIRTAAEMGRVEDAREMLKEKESVLSARRSLNRVARKLTDINHEIRSVYESSAMTAEQKRAKIDELTSMKNELTKHAADKYWMLF